MKRLIVFILLVSILLPGAVPVWAHNPFTSKPETQHKAPEPPFKSQFFVKIILWQHQLKAKMSELIRGVKEDGNFVPVLFLMALAFAYGVLHAAGPGHGKVVATSYVLSHNTSVLNGILFGLCIAMIHGFSGAVGVLGLRYIIEQSVSETLTTATTITQIISFGLIFLLGLAILLKHIYVLVFSKARDSKKTTNRPTRKGLLPWAVAVGLVPCPAVVMVMLFCLSMDVMVLGLVLSACIAIGMGATISLVVTAVVLGKSGLMKSVSEKRATFIEGTIGLLSGTAIAAFGVIFLLATITETYY